MPDLLGTTEDPTTTEEKVTKVNKTQAQQAVTTHVGPEDVVLTHVGGTTWKVQSPTGSLYRVRLSDVKRGTEVPEILEVLAQPAPKAKAQAKASPSREWQLEAAGYEALPAPAAQAPKATRRGRK